MRRGVETSSAILFRSRYLMPALTADIDGTPRSHRDGSGRVHIIFGAPSRRQIAAYAYRADDTAALIIGDDAYC